VSYLSESQKRAKRQEKAKRRLFPQKSEKQSLPALKLKKQFIDNKVFLILGIAIISIGLFLMVWSFAIEPFDWTYDEYQYARSTFKTTEQQQKWLNSIPKTHAISIQEEQNRILYSGIGIMIFGGIFIIAHVLNKNMLRQV